MTLVVYWISLNRRVIYSSAVLVEGRIIFVVVKNVVYQLLRFEELRGFEGCGHSRGQQLMNNSPKPSPFFAVRHEQETVLHLEHTTRDVRPPTPSLTR
jgi:hypothetical protein